MKFTNNLLMPISLLTFFPILFFLFFLFLAFVQKENVKKCYKENTYSVMLSFLIIFLVGFFGIFIGFILDYNLSGPVKEMKTNSFTIVGKDETIVVTVKEKGVENQTFAFDKDFQLISDVRNVNGKLGTDFKDEDPLTYYTLEDFKNKFVNTKKKNKFKLIYTEKKYINETLFQTIIRTLSGRKVNQNEIKTSVTIKLTDNYDFNYEQ